MGEVILKADVFGKMAENMVNASPVSGGVHRKASWCAHEKKLLLEIEQADRMAILLDNRRLYNENKGKARNDLAGGVPLRIPKYDYYKLYEDNSWLNQATKEEKAKFFKKLYREHPEYRIG